MQMDTNASLLLDELTGQTDTCSSGIQPGTNLKQLHEEVEHGAGGTLGISILLGFSHPSVHVGWPHN